MTFDPKRRIVMATFKTVLGHNLPAGTPLVIAEEPAQRGEVDLQLATRLFNSKNAVYAEDARPTPVETPEQERARLAAERLRDAGPGGEDEGQLVPTDDLVTWPADDAETGAKAGDRVTNEHLRAIATREGAVVESDDNKADLQQKIMLRRALGNSTYTQTGQGTTGGVAADPASTGAGSGRGADTGAGGDAHGAAGEGQSDEGGE